MPLSHGPASTGLRFYNWKIWKCKPSHAIDCRGLHSIWLCKRSLTDRHFLLIKWLKWPPHLAYIFTFCLKSLWPFPFFLVNQDNEKKPPYIPTWHICSQAIFKYASNYKIISRKFLGNLKNNNQVFIFTSGLHAIIYKSFPSLVCWGQIEVSEGNVKHLCLVYPFSERNFIIEWKRYSCMPISIWKNGVSYLATIPNRFAFPLIDLLIQIRTVQKYFYVRPILDSPKGFKFWSNQTRSNNHLFFI